MKKVILPLLSGVILNATAPTQESVTKLYVATFKRAPDNAGLNYWVNDSKLELEAIATSFFDQPETQTAYPSSASNGDFINVIYNNLFNRTPDSKGFDYWLVELDKGSIGKSFFILAVVNGALDNDEKILQNKTAVGLVFASKKESNIDDAKNIMQDIDENPKTVSEALEKYDMTSTTQTSQKDTIPQNNGALVVTQSVNAEWNEGFCRNVTVTNTSSQDVIWNITAKIEGDIYTLWNANYTQDANTKVLTAKGVDWNSVAKANGGSSEFGYCANKVSTNGVISQNDSTQTDIGTENGNSNTTKPTNSSNSNFNADYAKVLGLSLEFYEAQRSDGPFPKVSWRKPAGLSDGSDVGKDLSGGWFDAGDGVKFNLPMAYSATILNWGIISFPNGYNKAGQGDYAKEQVKYALDYLMATYNEGSDASSPSDDSIYYQVGDVTADHNFWGPPEDMTMNRPTYTCNSSLKCAEVAGEMASAFASGSIVFASTNSSYSATLLDKAKKIYNFAKTYQGNNGYTATQGAYSSHSGYNDELAWSAIWLYMATKDNTYLNDAKSFISKTNDATYWAMNWDDVTNGAKVLLYANTKDTQYKNSLDKHFNHWFNGVGYTSGGLAFLDKWGSLRYSANSSFLALTYAQTLPSTEQSNLINFAKGQINYMLGDNPRDSSYVIGYGKNYPINPHHRASHNSVTHNINSPTNNEFLLKGALVGGPKSKDDFNYKDDRMDYVANEVATDYNAGFTGVLAGLLSVIE